MRCERAVNCARWRRTGDAATVGEVVSGVQLERFLQQQRSEGLQESTGVFTISLEEAVEKLGRYRLPRKSAWVSLLVQSAVAWGCPRLEVLQSRYLSHFRFHEPAEGLPDEETVRLRLGTAVDPSEPLGRLCMALQSLVAQAELSFRLFCGGGDGISGGSFFKVEDHRPEGWALTVYHLPEDEKGWTQSLRAGIFRLPIADELRCYAAFSPMEITVDGIRVDGDPLLGCVLLGCGAQTLRLSPSLPLPGVLEDRFRGAQALVLLGADCRPGRHKPKAHVRWVRHGVVVHESPLGVDTRRLEVSVVLNAEGLKSDLSGFQLMESREKELRETEALAALDRELRRSRESLTAWGERALAEAHRDPGVFERANLPYFVLLPAPLIATGSLIALLGMALFFGEPILGLMLGWFGTGVAGVGNYLSPSSLRDRREAPVRNLREYFSELEADWKTVEEALGARAQQE